jgi:diguanylate cyclase (GGDEF)-like protein
MEELEQYKERLRIALRAAGICVFEVDLTRQRYTFFENAEAIFGVPGDVILKEVRPFSALDPEAYRLAVSNYFSHPGDTETIRCAFASILSGVKATYEARMKAGGSDYVWCRIHAVPILQDGRPVRMVGVITDINDLKREAESLQMAASLDGFTGLYNKGNAVLRMEETLRCEQALRHALVMLDVDGFKQFNDTYGHAQGDVILKGVARKLKGALRKTDVVGRFGGDEFILLVRDISDPVRLRAKLQSLARFEIDGYACSLSIGVALYPQDAQGFDELFQKADAALYRAKASKGKVVFCGDL